MDVQLVCTTSWAGHYQLLIYLVVGSSSATFFALRFFRILSRKFDKCFLIVFHKGLGRFLWGTFFFRLQTEIFLVSR